jgi:uncharacterized membrane protein YuzA (DUF378 family)
MTKMKILDIIAITLLIVGGLNWGLKGFFNFNLVEFLFRNLVLQRIVYGTVGVASIYSIYSLWRNA